MVNVPVGLVSWGTYFPERVEAAVDLVERTGIPEDILVEKLGIRQRHIAGPDDTVTTMATYAARKALEKGGRQRGELGYLARQRV